VSYNGDATAEVLFMIARETPTDQFRVNPQYDDHYKNLGSPVVLHREAEHKTGSTIPMPTLDSGHERRPSRSWMIFCVCD